MARYAPSAQILESRRRVSLLAQDVFLTQRKRICRYFVMLAQDPDGKRLLTANDRKMFAPFLQGKTVRSLIAEMQENVAAFERGIDL